MLSAGSKTVADFGERIGSLSLHSTFTGWRTAVKAGPVAQEITPECFESSIGLGSADRHPTPD